MNLRSDVTLGEQEDSFDTALGPGEAPDTDSEATFAGDKGQLRVPTRRVLVQLLLGPALDARRHPKLWLELQRDEAVLRSRLHELFLELVVDHRSQVAFTRQVVSEEISVPVLLRKASLTFLESALLLFLRQQLTQADAQDERAVVDQCDMVEHLRVYERSANVDQARFARQMETALEKAKKLGLLQSLRGSPDRFEISPTLKLLFPAEDIAELTRTYQALSAGAIAGELLPDVGTDDSTDT